MQNAMPGIDRFHSLHVFFFIGKFCRWKYFSVVHLLLPERLKIPSLNVPILHANKLHPVLHFVWKKDIFIIQAYDWQIFPFPSWCTGLLLLQEIRSFQNVELLQHEKCNISMLCESFIASLSFLQCMEQHFP